MTGLGVSKDKETEIEKIDHNVKEPLTFVWQ